MGHERRQPTPEDLRLIIECKKERQRLRKQLAELSNDVLARKFEVSRDTIQRISEADLYE